MAMISEFFYLSPSLFCGVADHENLSRDRDRGRDKDRDKEIKEIYKYVRQEKSVKGKREMGVPKIPAPSPWRQIPPSLKKRE